MQKDSWNCLEDVTALRQQVSFFKKNWHSA
jgi:hypothetical protein